MRVGRLGTFLLTLGVLVGVVAGIGLLVGFEPARLPAALLNVAAYKLTLLAAFAPPRFPGARSATWNRCRSRS
jgi:hypothetical protein